MSINKLMILILLFTSLTGQAQSVAELKMIRAGLEKHTRDTLETNYLLDLGKYYLNKPGEVKQDLDSALLLTYQSRRLGTQLKYLPGVARSFRLEAEIFREKGDRDRAWTLTQNSLRFAEQHRLNKEIGEAYISFTSFFNNDDDQLKKKISYTEKALPFLKAGGALRSEATALKNLGDFYQLQDNYTQSIKALQESLAIYERIGFKEIQGVTDLLGYVYQTHGETMLALKYGLIAVKTAEALQDSSPQLFTIYNRIGMTYYILKKNELSLSYYQKALKVAQRYKDADAIKLIKYNIVFLMLRFKKPAECLAMLKTLVKEYPPQYIDMEITTTGLFANLYMDLQQNNKALPYINKLLAIRKEHGKEPVYTHFLNQPVIRYYFVTGQYSRSYPFLRRNDSLLKFHSYLKAMVDNEQLWSRIDSATGQYLSALKHYQLFKKGSDSLKNDNLNKQLKELQFQFDVDNKDRNILFLTQKGQIQQAKIRSAAVIWKVTVAGLFVLCILSGLIYRSYYIKKRSNQLLTLKQEEINHQNNLLKRLLDEKEWLLKEIHHRVKNNLQIVISLLNTQSAYLDNEDALFAIRNSQHRMNAISLIHQKLYQSENLAAIDLSVYIHELADYLKESFTNDKRIGFELRIAALTIDVAQAVPLGLILNEAISNSIKYAFDGSQDARITVSLQDCADGSYELIIADNGKGLPADFDPDQSESLGMSLMNGLATQLDAKLQFENKNGLNVSVIFKPKCISLENITV